MSPPTPGGEIKRSPLWRQQPRNRATTTACMSKEDTHTPPPPRGGETSYEKNWSDRHLSQIVILSAQTLGGNNFPWRVSTIWAKIPIFLPPMVSH